MSERLWLWAVLVLTACDTGSFTRPDGAGDGYLPGYLDGGGIPTPTCPGEETDIAGTVLAPNGKDPVPGATVFIPAQVPEIFPPQVQCEVCGHLGSSNNLWQTTTGADGKFVLKRVCPKQRPIVFQNGRFRRMILFDVPVNTQITLTPDRTRLPQRNAEFHPVDAIPKIAVATGDYDKMECVLRKMGLPEGTFDLYEDAYSRKSPTALPSFRDLVNNLAQMKTYNIIFINCTGNTFESELTKMLVRQNITDYIQSGGRLYVTDWSYDWIEQVEDFSPFIDFEPGPSGSTPEKQNAAALGADGLQVSATIKDASLAAWLANFPGAIASNQSHIEHFLIDWVIMNKLGQDVKLWVEGQISSNMGDISGLRPLTVTFNFKNCGKVLYSSYHTEGRENELFPEAYPKYCNTTMSPQDRILEFLIFDIASCIKPIE